LGNIVTAASGELALVNGQPGVGDPFIAAYVNWGGYVSLPAPNDGETLEEAAVDDDVWFAGDTVDVNGQTTIFANGDVVDENGFGVCTEEP
ncbi:MAG TPA: hypothetical protein VMG12_00880, partial [Polyangiaceae bacterium]|nr:hypothetical protein [Polyangiaceae bacterium]